MKKKELTKRRLFVYLGLIVLALDYLAVRAIVKGEGSLGEYVTLTSSVFLIIVIIFYFVNNHKK